MKIASTLLFTTCLLAGVITWPLGAAAAPPMVGGDSGSPEEQACMGKVVSDPCTLPNGSAGACGDGTCSRLDYSQGSPPKATEEACIVCKAGVTPGNPPAVGGSGGGSGGSSSNGEQNGASNDAGDKEPPESSSRCSLTDSPEPLGTSLLLLGLLVVWRRRR